MQPSGTQAISVALDESLLRFVPSAVLRLSYTDPDISVDTDDAGLKLACSSEMSVDVARRKVMHALYREKVLADTLPLRVGLLNLLAAR